MFTRIAIILCIASAVYSAANITVQPLLSNGAGPSGDYAESLPVATSNNSLCLSGTTKVYVHCREPLEADSCSLLPISVSTSTDIQDQLTKAGVIVCNTPTFRPFLGNSSWDATITFHVQNVSKVSECTDAAWGITLHASPDNSNSPVPTSWTIDAVLVGSFAQFAPANYDGHYFLDPNNQLYLIYNKEHTTPRNRDGIVAQPMSNPTTLTGEATFLLLPDADLGSEDAIANSTTHKLVETGNLVLINNTYVLLYSTGDYDRPTYKVGVAYSDTLLGEYRKVYQDNPDHLWGTDGPEVLYLLQSQVDEPGWNYVGNQVLAPGIASVIEVDGSWNLVFAAFDTSQPITNGVFARAQRHPYFVGLDINIAADLNVSTASNSSLQQLIRPFGASLASNSASPPGSSFPTTSSTTSSSAAVKSNRVSRLVSQDTGSIYIWLALLLMSFF